MRTWSTVQKTLIGLALLIGSTTQQGFAADPILDVVSNPRIKSDYFVSFCAVPGVVGHAFVVIGEHDPVAMVSRQTLAVGFWPKADSDKKRIKALFAPLPGTLKVESTVPSQCRLTKAISRDEFHRLEIKFGAFKEREYTLLGTNCVEFVAQTAESVGLIVPDRQQVFQEFKQQLKRKLGREPNEATIQESFPEYFVRKLTEANVMTK